MPAKVLVIEDNPANRELMLYLLQAFGHTAVAAVDGVEGFEKARFESPDLIVCDIQLPRIDGYELARKLKEHVSLAMIPLLAVTAFAMVGDRDKILAGGFDGYIPKPIDPETFITQVDAFLPLEKRSKGSASNTETAADAAASDGRRGTILLVDNSPSNLSVLRSILEPSGYKTLSAERVSEALAMARENPPDLILSDLHMPGANGQELLRLVKIEPALASVPLIIISASNAGADEIGDALSSGAIHFIVRPIDPEKLLSEIATCLRPPGEKSFG